MRLHCFDQDPPAVLALAELKCSEMNEKGCTLSTHKGSM